MHLTDETLRRFLDNEISEEAYQAAKSHLDSCETCRIKLEQLQEQMNRFNMRFSPQPASAADSKTALSRLVIKEKEIVRMKTQKSRRPLWATLTVLAALAIAFTFPPVQGFAAQILQLFRVQQFQTFPIESLSLENLTNDPTLLKAITELFSDSVEITNGSPENWEIVESAEQAETLVNYHVRIPTYLEESKKMQIDYGFSFRFTVNQEKVEEILALSKNPALQIPENLDGQTVEVVIPDVVSAGYGECWEDAATLREPTWSWDEDCMLFLQTPSPDINSPASVDVNEIIKIAMLAFGSNEDEALAFSEAADWTTTLVLPVPSKDFEYEEITVDGVTGYLFNREIVEDPRYSEVYTLLWIKNEIIYMVVANGPDESGIELANSLSQ